MQKDREECHFKFYSELCYLELSLPGIRIIAFVVGLDSLTDFLAQRCELYNGFAAELNSIWNDIQ